MSYKTKTKVHDDRVSFVIVLGNRSICITYISKLIQISPVIRTRTGIFGLAVPMPYNISPGDTTICLQWD